MAVMEKRKPRRAKQRLLTKSDWKLIACVAVFATSVALKYADIDGAQAIRAQAAQLLHGGIDASAVVEVLGKTLEEQGVMAVFGVKTQEEKPGEIDGGSDAITPVEASPTQTKPEDILPAYAEGGYTEDLEGRAETLFPKQADETAYVASFAHIKPTEATVSSDYGARTHPITGTESYHFGLDLAAPRGTPIVSFAEGTVREAGNGSYGNYLIVDHADGFSTLYAHCDKLLAKKGEAVKLGQEIAQVGATGNATGNHLHFEIWRDGKALDPGHYVMY